MNELLFTLFPGGWVARGISLHVWLSHFYYVEYIEHLLLPSVKEYLPLIVYTLPKLYTIDLTLTHKSTQNSTLYTTLFIEKLSSFTWLLNCGDIFLKKYKIGHLTVCQKFEQTKDI